MPRIRLRRSVRTGVTIGMLDRLLHHGCLVTVGGDSSRPFAESAGPAPLTGPTRQPDYSGALFGEWRSLSGHL
jgi:hypothetical protein